MVVQALWIFEGWLKSKFEMTHHEWVKSFLGIAFLYTQNSLCLRQKNFINTVLQTLRMHNWRPVGFLLVTVRRSEHGSSNRALDQKLYQQTIGPLLFNATRTCPGIGAAVNNAAREASLPTSSDWGKVKRVMRYIHGTSELGLKFNWEHTNGLPVMIAYSEADWAGDLTGCK